MSSLTQTRTWSVRSGTVSKPRKYLGGRLHATGFDLTVAPREHLEQSQGLLHPLVAVDVLRHYSAISRSMATISFSTCWMSATISSSGRGGRYA